MDNFERLISVLERIALAFEEQNRQNAEWIATQTEWRTEAEALTAARYEEVKVKDQVRMEIEQRIAACHEHAISLQRGKLELEQASYNELSALMNRGQQ